MAERLDVEVNVKAIDSGLNAVANSIQQLKELSTINVQVQTTAAIAQIKAVQGLTKALSEAFNFALPEKFLSQLSYARGTLTQLKNLAVEIRDTDPFDGMSKGLSNLNSGLSSVNKGMDDLAAKAKSMAQADIFGPSAQVIEDRLRKQQQLTKEFLDFQKTAAEIQTKGSAIQSEREARRPIEDSKARKATQDLLFEQLQKEAASRQAADAAQRAATRNQPIVRLDDFLIQQALQPEAFASKLKDLLSQRGPSGQNFNLDQVKEELNRLNAQAFQETTAPIFQRRSDIVNELALKANKTTLSYEQYIQTLNKEIQQLNIAFGEGINKLAQDPTDKKVISELQKNNDLFRARNLELLKTEEQITRQGNESARLAAVRKRALGLRPEELKDFESFAERESLRSGLTKQQVLGVKPGFFEPGRLTNPETLIQLGFGLAFGDIPSLIGAAIGGSTPLGPAGALLGSTVTQGLGRILVERPLEKVKEQQAAIEEAGLAFQRSILGITAVRQANFETFNPSGQLVPNAQAAQFQRQIATQIQLGARSRLLPLGIAGSTEATFVQGITSALSQRGLNASPEQIARISELLGGAIVAQRPQLLENTSVLLRDIEDVLGGGPAAKRTVLSQLIRPALGQLQEARSPEQILAALEKSLAGFAETAKGLDVPIVTLNKLNAAMDNLRTVAGDKFLQALEPGFKALIGVLQQPSTVSAAEKLATTLGTLTAETLKLQSGMIDAGSAITNNLLSPLTKLSPTLLAVATAIAAIEAASFAFTKNSFLAGTAGPAIGGLASGAGAVAGGVLFPTIGRKLGEIGLGGASKLGPIGPSTVALGALRLFGPLAVAGLSLGAGFGVDSFLKEQAEQQRQSEINKLLINQGKFVSERSSTGLITSTVRQLGLESEFEKARSESANTPQKNLEIATKALDNIRARLLKKEFIDPDALTFLADQVSAFEERVAKDSQKLKSDISTPIGALADVFQDINDLIPKRIDSLRKEIEDLKRDKEISTSKEGIEKAKAAAKLAIEEANKLVIDALHNIAATSDAIKELKKKSEETAARFTKDPAAKEALARILFERDAGSSEQLLERQKAEAIRLQEDRKKQRQELDKLNRGEQPSGADVLDQKIRTKEIEIADKIDNLYTKVRESFQRIGAITDKIIATHDESTILGQSSIIQSSLVGIELKRQEALKALGSPDLKENERTDIEDELAILEKQKRNKQLEQLRNNLIEGPLGRLFKGLDTSFGQQAVDFYEAKTSQLNEFVRSLLEKLSNEPLSDEAVEALENSALKANAEAIQAQRSQIQKTSEFTLSQTGSIFQTPIGGRQLTNQIEREANSQLISSTQSAIAQRQRDIQTAPSLFTSQIKAELVKDQKTLGEAFVKQQQLLDQENALKKERIETEKKLKGTQEQLLKSYETESKAFEALINKVNSTGEALTALAQASELQRLQSVSSIAGLVGQFKAIRGNLPREIPAEAQAALNNPEALQENIIQAQLDKAIADAAKIPENRTAQEKAIYEQQDKAVAELNEFTTTTNDARQALRDLTDELRRQLQRFYDFRQFDVPFGSGVEVPPPTPVGGGSNNYYSGPLNPVGGYTKEFGKDKVYNDLEKGEETPFDEPKIKLEDLNKYVKPGAKFAIGDFNGYKKILNPDGSVVYMDNSGKLTDKLPGSLTPSDREPMLPGGGTFYGPGTPINLVSQEPRMDDSFKVTVKDLPLGPAPSRMNKYGEFSSTDPGFMLPINGKLQGGIPASHELLPTIDKMIFDSNGLGTTNNILSPAFGDLLPVDLSYIPGLPEEELIPAEPGTGEESIVGGKLGTKFTTMFQRMHPGYQGRGTTAPIDDTVKKQVERVSAFPLYSPEIGEGLSIPLSSENYFEEAQSRFEFETPTEQPRQLDLFGEESPSKPIKTLSFDKKKSTESLDLLSQPVGALPGETAPKSEQDKQKDIVDALKEIKDILTKIGENTPQVTELTRIYADGIKQGMESSFQ